MESSEARDARLALEIRPVDLAIAVGAVPDAVTAWEAQFFGPLNPSKTLRLVIPAVIFMTLGLETILSSFFLSILGLKRR